MIKLQAIKRVKRRFRLDSSLVLYLPLYELDGATFQSKDAYGHLSTVTGALWTPQGRSFDGLDDVINCGSPSILDTAFGGDTTGSYTYIWWQKQAASDGTNRGFLDKGADPNFWGIYLANGVLTLELKETDASNNMAATWPYWDATDADKFVHFALIGTGRAVTNWILYKNLGTLARTTVTNTLSSNISNLADNLFAPGRAYGAAGYFLGTIGEVSVYNRALTLAEIQKNYLTTKFRYQ